MKRHDLDVVSLVFGLFFAAVASWWGVNQLGNLNIPLGWPLAAALLVAGLVGLIGALPRRAREDSEAGTGPVGTDEVDDTPAR
jgi:apolipoprotein N-acyltransferase